MDANCYLNGLKFGRAYAAKYGQNALVCYALGKASEETVDRRAGIVDAAIVMVQS